MENKVSNNKNGIAKRSKKVMPTKKIDLKKDSYIVITHGDLKFSISVINSKSEYGTPYEYVLIHHDTTFKEVTFSSSLNAKVSKTNTDGSICDVSINEESA